MSINMSYCRYENVARGFEELTELLELDEEAMANLGDEELRYLKRLVRNIVSISEEIKYQYDNGDDNYTVEDGVKQMFENIDKIKEEL